MRTIIFDEVKDEIVIAIMERSKKINLDDESVTLLEGFISSPYDTKLSSRLVIGGPSVPMVILCGNETGRVYFFSFYILCPQYHHSIYM